MLLQLLTGLSLLEVVLGASCDKKFNASSPGAFSLYASSSKQDCKYDIWASSGRGVRLTWGGFSIKGKMHDCSDDYVEIFIGCGRHSIGKYCSENGNKPFDVYSRDGCLRIKFRSYRSSSFTATYSSFSLSTGSMYLSDSCDSTKTMHSTAAVINSPKWPRDYPSLQDCYWKIEVGSRRGVKIAFMDLVLEYDARCDDDKVKVKGGREYQSYDSSSTIGRTMCGTKNPFYFTSTKDRIWIRFKSDRSTADRGFVAGYVKYSTDTTSSGSSGDGNSSSSGSVAAGVVVPIIILLIGGGIYLFRWRRAKQQDAQQQEMTAQVQEPPQQTVVHHPPPAEGAAPPPQPGYAPTPYSQAVPAPYPQQDKAAAYPPAPQGGAPPYPPGQPGGVPPYPPEQPGEASPYPPGQPGGATPYPPGQPGGVPPYPPVQPGGAPPGGTSPYPSAPPGGAPYPPQ